MEKTGKPSKFKRAYMVYDKNDPDFEVVIAITFNSIKARKMGEKHFKDSSYFNLRTKRCKEFDNYLIDKPTLLTGEKEELYPLYKKSGWLVLTDQKKTGF